MGINEHRMTLSLYSYLIHKRKHDVVLPNYFLGEFECDMVVFHSEGTVTEYEIKTSKSDFKKDFTKKRKGSYKHKDLAAGRLPVNQFYFVVPNNLLTKEEVPTYAGLIYISKTGSVSIKKVAPVLNKRKYLDSVEKYRDLMIKLSFRELAWRQKYETLKLKYQNKNVGKMDYGT